LLLTQKTLKTRSSIPINARNHKSLRNQAPATNDNANSATQAGSTPTPPDSSAGVLFVLLEALASDDITVMALYEVRRRCTM